MIEQKYRFHSRGGVSYTYKHGKTIRTPKMSLVYNVNSRNRQRFGVVISKKVIKSAVGRNRVRRRIYEAIRLELPNFDSKLDCIFVVYARDVRTMEFTELQKLIRKLLSEAKTA